MKRPQHEREQRPVPFDAYPAVPRLVSGGEGTMELVSA